MRKGRFRWVLKPAGAANCFLVPQLRSRRWWVMVLAVAATLLLIMVAHCREHCLTVALAPMGLGDQDLLAFNTWLDHPCPCGSPLLEEFFRSHFQLLLLLLSTLRSLISFCAIWSRKFETGVDIFMLQEMHFSLSSFNTLMAVQIRLF
ncbi:uncharacterized protein LOC18037851 isoform X2 [Citrus clementina]|uniref:uncharacterized protein LOC18037851 isoform X2 n=1 Tax=Citrus clementina TaxID=85681 RepID=UPI000CED428C|nr:uncharacterized protein LOC18037851 isoform X2 [Citrus x clementina]